LANAEVLAEALAVALALGLTLDAAEMLTAVEPAVAAAVALELAFADELALEDDPCARATELSTIMAPTASIQASIASATNGTAALSFLNSTSTLLLP
jgi:hypothetical protein